MELAEILLEWYISQGQSVMLWSSPGLGKSSLVGQIAKRVRRKLIDMRVNLRDTVDFRGVPVSDLKTMTTKWLAPDELPRADRDGDSGLLFLDEINTAPMNVQAVCFQLTLEKKLGDYTLPEGWVVVAAGNYVGDRAAAQRMPTALRNRFAHIHVVDNTKAWVKWAEVNGVPPEFIAFARFREALFGQMPKGDENEFLTRRSFTAAAAYIDAPVKIRQSLFGGLIGHAQAAELEGFIKLYRSLGTLDGILANPDKANIPIKQDEADVRYAVCTGLARIVTKKTMPALIKYAERFGKETSQDLEVLMVTDATRRDPELCNVAAYGDWAVRNASILMQ
jgi:hypothetical protein